MDALGGEIALKCAPFVRADIDDVSAVATLHGRGLASDPKVDTWKAGRSPVSHGVHLEMARRLLHWRACVIVLCTAATFAARAGELRVGGGRVSVTTPAAEFPYLPSDTPSLNTGPGERSFTGVHDEVYARAMLIDDGVQRVALIVLEVTAVPRANEITQAVAQQLGISSENVMIAATHTHSVPLFSYSGGVTNPREEREIQRLKQGAVQAAQQAAASLGPARIAFARGQAWVNVNNGEQSGSKTGYDPVGPSDKSLDVLRFTSLDDEPIALLVNYASHAEVMFRSVTKNEGYEVSGDLPGAVSRLLEASSAGAPLVLFTSAAEADQLPLFKSLQSAGRLPATDEGAAGWALLDVQARRVAGSVLDVTATMPRGESHARVSARTGSVTCAGEQLRLNLQTGAALIEDRAAVTIPLSLIRINDIALAGVGGDVASEIGQHFKAASPLAASTLITLAGESVGYLFADASYAHPGHGLTKSPLKPHCADHAIVEGLVHLIEGTH
jgi:hypothetical protein